MNDQMMQWYNQASFQTGDPETKKRTRLIVLIVLAGLFIFVVWVIVAAIIARLNTGILHVATSNNASVTIQPTEGQQTKIGKGNDFKIRVKPGKYEVVATFGSSSTSAVVSVAKGKETTQQLKLVNGGSIQALANYSAQNIYASDSNLYFVNTLETLLYTMPVGSSSGRAYTTSLNPISQAYWLSPTSLYAQVNGGWLYYNNGNQQNIIYNEEPPLPNSISFNPAGAAAFTTSGKEVLEITSAGSDPQLIGHTKTDNTQTTIAPNGNVLVYSPKHDNAAKTEPTQLIINGSSTQLSSELTGIISAAWNADSTKFIYTTQQGIYVYDTNTKQSEQILTGEPTDQLSIAWLNSDTILYANSKTVWRHTLGSDTSTEVAAYYGILNSQNSFTIMPDGNTVYFSTAPDRSLGGQIYRLDLSGKTPSSLKVNANTDVTYFGDSGLVDHGITDDQMTNLKYAINDYARILKLTLTSVSIDDTSINHTLHPDDANILEFNVKLNNQQSYHVKLLQYTISKTRIYIYDTGGNQVYDSGMVNALNG